MSTRHQIRAWLIFFVVALVVSGLTAFPLETELRLGSDILHWVGFAPAGLVEWIDRVRDALIATNDD